MTHPLSTSEVRRAAATLSAARRVVVTGHGGTAAETAARACDLAEAIGAAIDFGGSEVAQVAGPSIARVGEVTADPADLRDRADLVVFWFCEPAGTAPGFLDRVVTPATATGRPRHTIAVGSAAVSSAAAADRHVPVAADHAVDLARLLHAALSGRTASTAPAPVATACAAIRTALDAAGCVAFVTAHDDPLGLAAWSLVGLVRTIAHRKPAFEVPLVPAGAATAVSTWRYGAAGAIARADRGGAAFRPAECDAARLVGRGEVDYVVAVGPLGEAVEAALAARGDAVTVIRLPADDAAARSSLDALIDAVRTMPVAGFAP